MSVVYKVDCDACGESLSFTVELDGDDDLVVTVEPCENCINDAREEAEKDE